MKLLPAIIGITVSVAAPAHAEPEAVEVSAADPGFLSSLGQLGITFSDPAQAIGAGKAVCGLAERGESGLELLNDLRTANPALTINGAAHFASVAARSYCPHQLEAAGGSAK